MHVMSREQNFKEEEIHTIKRGLASNTGIGILGVEVGVKIVRFRVK